MKTKKIIIQPVVSEKSFTRSEGGVYTFRVARDANKHEIKDAVEEFFKVKVEKISTLKRKGKKIMNWNTRKRSNRSDFKIAMITLKSGDTIDIFK